jgi:hypothetical protein
VASESTGNPGEYLTTTAHQRCMVWELGVAREVSTRFAIGASWPPCSGRFVLGAGLDLAWVARS